MRISAVQKETLTLLYALEQRNHTEVRLTLLLNLMKNKRPNLFHNNFSASCKKLGIHGFVILQRDESIRLWLSLTDSGRVIGEEGFTEWSKDNG